MVRGDKGRTAQLPSTNQRQADPQISDRVYPVQIEPVGAPETTMGVSLFVAQPWTKLNQVTVLTTVIPTWAGMDNGCA